MSKFLPFDNSLASIEDCLDALEHRKEDPFAGFPQSFSPLYSQNTTGSEKTAKCKHEKEISSLKHEIDGLKHIFSDKSGQVQHLEGLFHRALNQISFEMEAINEKQLKILQIEAKCLEKFGNSSSLHPGNLRSTGKSLQKTQDFSFSNNEGDETSNFSFGQIDENTEIPMPQENDCKDFEKFLKEQQSSFDCDKILEDSLHVASSAELTSKAFAPGGLVSERYRIESLLTSNGVKTTLACVDLKGKKVYLKVLHSQKESFDFGLDEVKTMNLLKRGVADKSVVQMIEFFYYKESLVIVFELLGESLAQINSNTATSFWLNDRNIQKIARQVLHALCFIHSKGVVHSNLTPGHILLDSPLTRRTLNHFQVKLIGFSSINVEQHLSQIAFRCYKPPEVLKNRKFSMKTDIWSLGCVLAELITGEVLFPGESNEEVLENVRVKQITEFSKDLHSFHATFSEKNRENSWIETLNELGGSLFTDLLSKLLSFEAEERPSAEEALKHPYFSEY
jgi:hypothetical protein